MKLYNRLKGNKYLMSFSLLASGSVIAQIFSMLLSPLTTRLYTPEQFGIYTIFITAISLFGPIICLKYEMSIVISKTDRDIYSVIALCLLICIPLSLILSVFYGLLFISQEYSGIKLIISIIIIFLLLVTYGLNNILVAHNNKNSLYKLISSVTVVKSVVSNGLMVIFGVLNFGVFGLLSSQLIANMAGLRKQSEDINKDKLNQIDLKSIMKVAVKHRNQPKYNALSALINTSIYSSINLFINNTFSAAILGYYSLSYRVLGIPFSVISANIAKVFFDNAVREQERIGSFRQVYIKTLWLLTLVILPLSTLLAILAPWIFSTIFGVEWRTAGIFVRLLSPMFAIRLIAESLTTSFIVAKKQHIEAIFQIFLFVGELIIYFATYNLNIQIENFLLMISTLYIIVYGLMIIYMNKISK
jgi:O-antigen/teichoic acid export membrane protein